MKWKKNWTEGTRGTYTWTTFTNSEQNFKWLKLDCGYQLLIFTQLLFEPKTSAREFLWLPRQSIGGVFEPLLIPCPSLRDIFDRFSLPRPLISRKGVLFMDLTAKKLVFFKLRKPRNLNLSFADEKRVSSPVTTSWYPQITSSHLAILYYFRLKKDWGLFFARRKFWFLSSREGSPVCTCLHRSGSGWSLNWILLLEFRLPFLSANKYKPSFIYFVFRIMLHSHGGSEKFTLSVNNFRVVHTVRVLLRFRLMQ